MANTVIIGTHGLATKPPEDRLSKQWVDCLWKTIERDAPNLKPKLGNRQNFSDNHFRLVYWANEIPDHLEDDDEWCFLIDQQLDKVF